MFRLPSFQTLADSFLGTVRRFPLAILVALVKTIVLIIWIETDNHQNEPDPLILKLLAISMVSLPLCIGLHLIAERRRFSPSQVLVGFGGILLLMVIYFFSMPVHLIQQDFYRFALYAVSAHLIISFLPFIRYQEPNGFWQFNKHLFLQSLYATLYAVTLFVGLLIAVTTVRFLFEIDYVIKIELDLAALIFGFFHTIFFLKDLPESLNTLEQDRSMPKGLKIFTQYVLLPLEVVYLIILYAYMAKILFLWKLPEGGVAYLILAFSVAGILALLLIYPLRSAADEKWVSLFSKRFHLALLPLIILLFVGIFRRIRDYGITENRYLVVVLAVWLLGITIYFIWSKKDDIRWIPVTLAIICLIISVGPWSIFAVSGNSQVNRFEAILTKYKLLNAQKVIEGKVKASYTDYEELKSIVNYFNDRSELAVLVPFFKDLPAEDPKEKFGRVQAIRSGLDAAIIADFPLNKKNYYVSYSTGSSGDQGSLIPVKGFDSILPFATVSILPPTKVGWAVQADSLGMNLSVYHQGDRIASWNLEKTLADLNKAYGMQGMEIPIEKMTLDYSGNEYGLRLIIQNLSGTNGTQITSGGLLMIREIKDK